MSNKGKTINLFLVNGNPAGLIKCTLSKWTGIAYKIPRTELNQHKNRRYLKQSGIYFLFGISDDSYYKNLIYIGQASSRKNGGGILNRLQEHTRNEKEDYWTEAIIFTTSNNTLGPTEISYLENKFCNLAISANRYLVKNTNDPSIGNVTEEKESELEEFIYYAKLLTETLGHKVFVPLDTNNKNIDSPLTEEIKKEPILHISSNSNDFYATGKRTNDGFVLFAGSRLAITPKNSCPKHIKNNRLKYKSKIKENILTEDILFNSPSGAAAFVTYRSTNGLTEWKTEKGQTLKDYETEENE